MKLLLIICGLLMLTGVAAGSSTPTASAEAEGGRPVIGAVTAEPDHVFTNIPVTVTVTCEISDERLLAGTIVLRPIDNKGKPVGDPVPMAQDAEEPSFYEARIDLFHDLPQTLRFRVSALFAGNSSRMYSKVLELPVTSLQPLDWRPFRSGAGYGFQHPAGWRVSESEGKTVSIFRPDQGSKQPAGSAPEIIIEYESNQDGLTPEEFFNGDHGADLFAGAPQVSDINVDGVAATQIVGLEALPYSKVVVTPLGEAFLVIYSNAPNDVFDLFLTTLTLGEKNEVEQ